MDRIGLYNPKSGGFYLRNELNSGGADKSFKFGSGGSWKPLAGDWEGAGEGIGLYNPGTGRFFVKNTLSGGAADDTFTFGGEGNWKPLAGDWDGDGEDTIGLYNADTGRFFLKNTLEGGAADATFTFGSGGEWEPLAGDWDGDGVDTVGLYNPGTGRFFVKNTLSGGAADGTFTFGGEGNWKPLAGDWDGDGTDGIGLYNPGTGRFFLKSALESGSHDTTFTFGGGGDLIPITGEWEGETAGKVFSLEADDVSVIEGDMGNKDAGFVLSLDGEPSEAVTVSYQTQDGTAGPEDYEGRCGTVVFEPGQSTATVYIPIIGDVDVEENETFTVTFSGDIQESVSAVGTIVNDDVSGTGTLPVGSDSLLAEYALASSDNTLTYSEMLSMLMSAAEDGISAGELSDLQWIDNNARDKGQYETDYLETVTGNLLYNNTANNYWWGGSTSYDDVESLGCLCEDYSEDSADKLIGKWFTGTDLPMPIAGGDAATGKVGNYAFDYGESTGPLMEAGVSESDVVQGSAGTCYYLAAIGSIANADPSLIQDMFIDNGNGSYGVKFYEKDGSLNYTTLNTSVPVKDNGSIAFAGSGDKSLSSETWVSLAEKAYAQYNSQLSGDLDANSYQAIEGGLAAPIKQVAGLNYTCYSSYYNNFPDPYSSGTLQSSDPSTYKQTIIDALESGSIGWLGSWGYTLGENGKYNLVKGHAYMLLGYNSETDKFILSNPWGNGSGKYNGKFEEPIESFWNSEVKAVVALSDGTESKDYTYTVNSDAGSLADAVVEGGTITFTIAREGSGTSSTVYLQNDYGTANEGTDYEYLDKEALNFNSYETEKTVTVDVYTDNKIEGPEYFYLDLYKNYSDSDSYNSTKAYIDDSTDVQYNYTISTNAGISNPITEGDEVEFTIERDGSGTDSTVYLNTVDGTANANVDYGPLKNASLFFAPNETSKTVTVDTYLDEDEETTEESFYLRVFKEKTNDIYTDYEDSAPGYIKDVSGELFSYTMDSNTSENDPALEGEQVTFTITRDGTGAESTVFLSTVGGTASGGADYESLLKEELVFKDYETTKQVTIDVYEDWWKEGKEYFELRLYDDDTDGFDDYLVNSTAYIDDVDANFYNYAVSTTATSDNPVLEGGQVTFTITRDGSGTTSKVYLKNDCGSAEEGTDYEYLDKEALAFASYETEKKVTVDVYTDNETEGLEYFYMDLYENYGDSGYSTYDTAFIEDSGTSVIPEEDADSILSSVELMGVQDDGSIDDLFL